MIQPAKITARFNRIEVQAARKEIFRFELGHCDASSKFYLTCHLGQNVVGHLDFSVEQSRKDILITESSFYLSTVSSGWEDYVYSNCNYALEVVTPFQKRHIAHSLFGVLVQWGRQEGYQGIEVPQRYAPPRLINEMTKVGFVRRGNNYYYSFAQNVNPRIAIR
jgi:hypothetical protein